MAIVVDVNSNMLREQIILRVKLPPLFRTRMVIVMALIKLAALVAWCSIEVEVAGNVEGNTDAN